VPPETNHSAVAKRVAGELGELATKTPVKGNLSAEAQAVLDRSFAAIPESDVVCHMVLQSVLCLANSNRAEAAHEMSAFIATKCKDSATASDATVPPTSAAASKDTGPDGGAADAAIDAPRDPPGKPPLEAQIAQKPCKTLCEKAYTSGIAQCVQIPDKASVDYRNCPKEKTSKRQSCLEGCKQ
jgi:hypothetical protein